MSEWFTLQLPYNLNTDEMTKSVEGELKDMREPGFRAELLDLLDADLDEAATERVLRTTVIIWHQRGKQVSLGKCMQVAQIMERG